MPASSPLTALSVDAARHFRIGAYHWLVRGRAVVGTVFRHADEDVLDEESEALIAAGLLAHVGERDWHTRHCSGTYAILAPTPAGLSAMQAIIDADTAAHTEAGDLTGWMQAVRSHDHRHLPTRQRAELLARSRR